MLKHLRSSPITYSQNFIAKRHLAEILVQKIPTNLLKNSHVIEIGPGKGRLTEFLVETSRTLTTVEVDYNLWKRLRERYKMTRNIAVLCGDFIDYELPSSEEYVVVSNLPFFLARTIILKLLKATHRPKALYVIIQMELYQQLSRSEFARHCALKVLHSFRRADFEPMPKVESVFVEILPLRR